MSVLLQIKSVLLCILSVSESVTVYSVEKSSFNDTSFQSVGASAASGSATEPILLGVLS